ncbi:DUF1289 domain-containing protein [Acinetobacter sp. MD2]|uniref:DUF1289 domain-containing protein n=1 Tax=Acinetobacter sp. MD2 TaxID=2600066 RepID=UPI002D1E7DF5|nr:DUF1289 domain-containing protein [Acinetobacter sp. MD2]MEB3767614.1 DUF1289 domain-containing protein [Acinetobacter sp. MD2]
MSSAGRIPTVTPCAGRCSTTFGDHVCRGCRRFNHEIIRWNSYTEAQQLAIWKRLDMQLDQILIPMLAHANLHITMQFLVSKRIRFLEQASTGRKLYYALRVCEKNKHLADESGLGLSAEQIKPLWREFERRILSLAEASYDLAWLRADGIQNSLLQVELED